VGHGHDMLNFWDQEIKRQGYPRDKDRRGGGSILDCLGQAVFPEKTGPFSFEHNLGKYCPILIFFSLLQTEINCDQVYPKICPN